MAIAPPASLPTTDAPTAQAITPDIFRASTSTCVPALVRPHVRGKFIFAGEEKFYVQDRMRQVGGELWSWIADGAHIYVCGAITMGKDVERALVDLVAAHGARTIDQAIAFVADLKKKGRYQQDVY